MLTCILLLASLSPLLGLQCDDAGPRIDCGFFGISQSECEQKGCCWNPVTESQGRAHIDLPWCFYSNGEAGAYELMDFTETDGGDGYSGRLELREPSFTAAGPDVEQLQLRVDNYAQDIVRVQLLDANADRWQVPEWPFPLAQNREGSSNSEASYDITCSHNPFGVKVFVKEGGRVLFDTTNFRLLYKEQYLEWTTAIPKAASIFGFGERTTSGGLRLEKNGLPRAIWSRDWGSANPDVNLYGHHPFYTQVNEDGSAHGVLLLNSNGMDVVVSESSISYRVVGGVLDFFFLVGPTPLSVLDQLTRVVGRPAMPPFWSLGFHQCRWGYKDVDELKSVVQKYSEGRIPLETIWSDIDYMDGYRVFTLNPQHYAEGQLQEFLSWLHGRGQHWVPIMDPGVKIDEQYSVYQQGIQEDVFLKDVTGEPYVGMVWPGAVHYPDFLHSAGRDLWQQQISSFHERVPFDGMWIDMNEASNFCTGEVCRLQGEGGSVPVLVSGNECPLKCFTAEAIRSTIATCDSSNGTCPPDFNLLAPSDEAAENLRDYVSSPQPFKSSPYAISNTNNLSPLGTNAIGLSVTHAEGEVEYDVHSLYGLMEAVATHTALKNVTGKRPFVLTRSSFPGSGAYAAHWTGDNAATWDNMYWSLLGTMHAGMVGMPMAGADICGFSGTPDEELCARWISVGAFYPFSRNHHAIDSGTQELYKWTSVAASGRKALSMRYALLAYMYTGLQQAARGGCPLMRPLFMNFPHDRNTHGIDRQFMLGDGILVTPVLEKSSTHVTGYFPPGMWYNMWDEEHIEAGPNGTLTTLHAPLGHIPLHVAGGHVIPMQRPMMTTQEVRRQPLTLLVTMPMLSSSLKADSLRPLDGSGGGGRRCAEDDLPHMCHTGVPGGMVACGQVYLDSDDDVDINNSSGATLTVTSKVTAHADGITQSGELLAIFGATPSFARNADDCTSPSAASWPELHAITLLGIANSTTQDAVLEEVLVGGAQAQDGNPVVHVVATRKLHKAHVLYNTYRQELHFPNINLKLACPTGLRLRWNATLLDEASEA